MSHEDLLTLVHRRPFQPLRLFISDGSTYDIRHPDLIMVGKRSLVVGLTIDPADETYDRFATIDLLHVARAEPLQPSSAAGNGQ